MPSNKFTKRRSLAVAPHICHPPPKPGGGAATKCNISPPELYAGPGTPYIFDIFGCCPPLGEVTATVQFACTGGEWQDQELPLQNCTGTTPNTWTSPWEPGSYILTATITWPNSQQCISTAIAYVPPEE